MFHLQVFVLTHKRNIFLVSPTIYGNTFVSKYSSFATLINKPYLVWRQKYKLVAMAPSVIKKQVLGTGFCNHHSLDSRALLNKSLILVKYFICGKVLKLFYHHDL